MWERECVCYRIITKNFKTTQWKWKLFLTLPSPTNLGLTTANSWYILSDLHANVFLNKNRTILHINASCFSIYYIVLPFHVHTESYDCFCNNCMVFPQFTHQSSKEGKFRLFPNLSATINNYIKNLECSVQLSLFRKNPEKWNLFNWVPPSENAQTWLTTGFSLLISGKHVQGPVFPLVHATVSYFLSPSRKLDITMGKLRPYPIDPYLCGSYSSSPSPIQPKRKKKFQKTFLMFPSQWTELEALFHPWWGPKSYWDPGCQSLLLQGQNLAYLKHISIDRWVPMSSEPDRTRTKRQHYSWLSL